MRTVYTKEEFKKALEAKENKIIVRGQLANEIKKKKQNKKKGAIAVGLAGLAAIGASIATGGTGAVAGLTAGPVVISTFELAILVGGGLGMTALLKGYRKVVLNPDGGVVIER